MQAERPDLVQDLMRLKPDGISPNRWAAMAGVSRTVWSDMRRHGNPARRTLEKLLVAAGSSLAEFEALRVGGESTTEIDGDGGSSGVADHASSGWRGVPSPPITVRETRQAGTKELPSLLVIGSAKAETVARPPSLAADREAYAICVVEDSMWPRFRVGRLLIVTPAATARPGDDVVVKMVGEEGRALVKELVRATPTTVELRQYNPDRTFTVPAYAVSAIEKVAGEAI